MSQLAKNLFDQETFDKLVSFIPLETAKLTRQAVDEASQLFLHDRHFDVLAKTEGLLEELARVEKDLERSPILVEPNSNDIGGGKVPERDEAPTSLSVGLLRTWIEDCPLHKVALHKVKECKFLVDDIDDRTSWKPTTKIDENGYGTYYRAEPGKSAHSFKVIGEVQESVLHVVSVIMELDLYTEWFPFCCEAVMQGEITKFHKSSKFVVKMPWPMSDREVFLIGYGVDDLQHRKRVIITSRSVSETEDIPPTITRPTVGKGRTRIAVEVGGFLIEALSPTSCRVSFIMNVDPLIPHVPLSLVNWVSGKMIWVLLYQMDKAAKRAGTPGSKYTERRKKRPDIYVHLQNRAVEVYAHHFPGEDVPSLDKVK